jgi:hypothetical protein
MNFKSTLANSDIPNSFARDQMQYIKKTAKCFSGFLPQPSTIFVSIELDDLFHLTYQSKDFIFGKRNSGQYTSSVDWCDFSQTKKNFYGLSFFLLLVIRFLEIIQN